MHLHVWGTPMSQGAFEAALGKVICDDAFRREFYEDAERAVARSGFQLTPDELSSLRNITLKSIERFVRHVDDRVRRAPDTSGTPPPGNSSRV